MKNKTVKKGVTKTKNKIVLAALIAAVAIVTVVVSLVSCSWFKKDEPIDVQVQNALQEVLNVAMSGEEDNEKLLSETESRNGFRVLFYDETDTGAVVTFLVYSPDLYAVAKEIDENYEFETEEELQNAVIDAISRAEIIAQEVTVEFLKTDDGYEPVLTEEFFDAYYGGVLKLFSEAIDKMTKEAAE